MWLFKCYPIYRKALNKENGEDLKSEYGMRALQPDEVMEKEAMKLCNIIISFR